MGTPSRDRDGEKTKRFRERWCKHQRSEEPQQDRGRDRQTERGDKPEIQTEEETGRQSANCFFSRGPAGEFWEGLGTGQWCPSGGGGIRHWEAPEMCVSAQTRVWERLGVGGLRLLGSGEAGVLDSRD